MVGHPQFYSVLVINTPRYGWSSLVLFCILLQSFIHSRQGQIILNFILYSHSYSQGRVRSSLALFFIDIHTSKVGLDHPQFFSVQSFIHSRQGQIILCSILYNHSYTQGRVRSSFVLFFIVIHTLKVGLDHPQFYSVQSFIHSRFGQIILSSFLFQSFIHSIFIFAKTCLHESFIFHHFTRKLK